jgi:hypothetical protein
MISRRNIKYYYQNGKWVVKQRLDSFSDYFLNGDFAEVIEKLIKRKNELYDEYVNNPSEMKGEYFLDAHYRPAKVYPTYPEATLSIQFDKIEIEYYREDDSTYFAIMGNRDATPEEAKALQEKDQLDRKASLERERANFELLKKKFEG